MPAPTGPAVALEPGEHTVIDGRIETDVSVTGTATVVVLAEEGAAAIVDGEAVTFLVVEAPIRLLPVLGDVLVFALPEEEPEPAEWSSCSVSTLCADQNWSCGQQLRLEPLPVDSLILFEGLGAMEWHRCTETSAAWLEANEEGVYTTNGQPPDTFVYPLDPEGFREVDPGT